jgi:hypothetical protein
MRGLGGVANSRTKKGPHAKFTEAFFRAAVRRAFTTVASYQRRFLHAHGAAPRRSRSRGSPPI